MAMSNIKRKAFENLKQYRKEAESITSEWRGSPRYKHWCRGIQIAIRKIFGDDSEHESRFMGAGVGPRPVFGATYTPTQSQLNERFMTQIKEKCTVIETIIQEIENYGNFSENEKEDLMGQYDAQQVCLNGHQITSSYHDYPQYRQSFCDKCGQKTIYQCPSCNTDIRGYYSSPGIVGEEPSVSKFCHNCGKPYPWTEAALKAARELVKDIEGLTDSEKLRLTQSLDDIIRDTPQTPVAAGRFKRLVVKAGQETAGVFKDILTDIISETAKKMIYGSGS
jgi:hypothetical protein